VSWKKASDILTSTLAAFLFSSHPKLERDREAPSSYLCYLLCIFVVLLLTDQAVILCASDNNTRWLDYGLAIYVSACSLKVSLMTDQQTVLMAQHCSVLWGILAALSVTYMECVVCSSASGQDDIITRHSSGDEIANVNFFTMTSSTAFTQCVLEMTYNVFSGTLNPTHSLTGRCRIRWNNAK